MLISSLKTKFSALAMWEASQNAILFHCLASSCYTRLAGGGALVVPATPARVLSCNPYSLSILITKSLSRVGGYHGKFGIASMLISSQVMSLSLLHILPPRLVCLARMTTFLSGDS
ncbi:hypothetical protein K431DRAFT_12033 [Polychaeton citri CBS 116435]|uniref:Uncharacterized protein n=1 Tax=Polychaeton citri CBS 116435 TaxID=1314669 RepID=A0A9P4PXA7_9PEZI|nr:hypothetical protein K431DRAFT_12033 [Polychaeton citri CBS 116435]